MRTCPNCHEETTQIKTMIAHDKLVTGCPTCITGLVQGNELYGQNKRTHDRREHRKSNVQPVEIEEYIQAYPEHARDLYDEDTLRRHGL